MFQVSTEQLTIAGLIVFLLSLLGVVSAIQAVMTARTSQGAIAWAVTLLTWPVLAVPAYWILGRNRFLGYIDARREKIDPVFDVLTEVQPQYAPHEVDLGTQFGEARVLEQLARMKFTRHNDVRLLVDGEATFDAIFQSLDGAQQYVLVEFFIINDDGLGRRLHDCLIRCARRGVDVYLLYDDVGSSRITKAFLAELTAAGVQVTGMNTTRGWRNSFQLNFRNHRKIVVVDGKEAFVGGHNVGDEYLGKHPRLTPWRDTHLGVTGPVVLAAQLTFVEDWHWATQQMPEIPWKLEPAPEADRIVLMVPSGPADDYETCGLLFTHAINSAKSRIWIATPYFVPDEGIVTALQLAAMRGVDVRILIPGLADKPFIKSAAMSYVGPVSEAGVRMFEYGNGFLHQKVMLIDDQAATVGTANLDNRSFRLNFEISVLTIDEPFAAEVRKMLEDDFSVRPGSIPRPCRSGRLSHGSVRKWRACSHRFSEARLSIRPGRRRTKRAASNLNLGGKNLRRNLA